MTSQQRKPEPLGQRLAQRRSQLGWTQNALAERLAASRVAVSHFEAGLAIPSERTIVLLAGLFGLEPHELVEGTDYPIAKGERLPLVACRYTEADLQIALMQHECGLLADYESEPARRMHRLAGWHVRLQSLLEQTADPGEQGKLLQALESLGRI